MYYGARYYDPALARFISADTIYDAGPQGLNRYSYALNNPIIYRDPTGHEAEGDETWEVDPNYDDGTASDAQAAEKQQLLDGWVATEYEKAGWDEYVGPLEFKEAYESSVRSAEKQGKNNLLQAPYEISKGMAEALDRPELDKKMVRTRLFYSLNDDLGVLKEAFQQEAEKQQAMIGMVGVSMAASIIAIKIPPGKKSNQVSSRGWTKDSIDNTVNNPYTTREATNKATGNKATVYYRQDGHYVVRDDVTGDLVQMSDTSLTVGMGAGQWKPDLTIKNPYIP